MAAGIVEDKRGHALLDHCGAPAVLDLVEHGAALALATQQAPCDVGEIIRDSRESF